MTNKAYQERG